MKKLKIKDNVNLKDLEKLDFKILHYVNGNMWGYDDKNGYYNLRIGEHDRILHFNHLGANNTLPSVIYNLIKADIVEVVDE